jgi:hypothetical protein
MPIFLGKLIYWTALKKRRYALFALTLAGTVSEIALFSIVPRTSIATTKTPISSGPIVATQHKLNLCSLKRIEYIPLGLIEVAKNVR